MKLKEFQKMMNLAQRLENLSEAEKETPAGKLCLRGLDRLAKVLEDLADFQQDRLQDGMEAMEIGFGFVEEKRFRR